MHPEATREVFLTELAVPDGGVIAGRWAEGDQIAVSRNTVFSGAQHWSHVPLGMVRGR